MTSPAVKSTSETATIAMMLLVAPVAMPIAMAMRKVMDAIPYDRQIVMSGILPSES
ncbi:hypothetical protein RvVAT039_17790 [Agrobacterium vitis]|nr:hypothetical protein RvVAT039_17790 [Agrobacterium vitis]